MIESGFKTNAYSRSKALGIWQFIPASAKYFKLKKSWWLDERKDPEKSTEAAINYLSLLHKRFNHWYLAMAAYNAGEGKVARAIKRHQTEDFWNLDLPQETENYIPKIIAAMLISKNPQKYGFNPKYQKTIMYDTIYIQHCLTFQDIAKSIDVSLHIIKKLNPELKKNFTCITPSKYLLKLPVNTKSKFLAAYQKNQKSQLIEWIRHPVKPSETLGHLALRYNIPIDEIRKVNSLTSNTIVAGKYLIIPVPKLLESSTVTKKITEINTLLESPDTQNAFSEANNSIDTSKVDTISNDT